MGGESAPPECAQTAVDRRRLVSGALLILALVAVQLVGWRSRGGYFGSVAAHFSLAGAAPVMSPPAAAAALPAKDGALFVRLHDGEATLGPIRSAVFHTRGDSLLLQCAGEVRIESKGGIRIHVQPAGPGSDANSPVIGELPYWRLQLSEQPLSQSEWTAYTVPLPPMMRDRDVFLEIEISDSVQSHDGWFAIRNRIERRSVESWGNELAGAGALPLAVLPLGILAGAMLVRVLGSGGLAECSNRRLFAGFVLLGCLVHVRPETFFYFDEYHVFERFQSLGLAALFVPHNEHFIPLCLGWLYAEAKLFGAVVTPYLLVTCCLHAMNGVLLTLFLERLLSPRRASRELALFVATGFLLHSVYSETMQWILEQAVLLCEGFTLGAMVLAWDFCRRGGFTRLGGILLCVFAAPLCFGNGFAAAPIIVAVTIVTAVLHRGVGGEATRRAALVFLVAGMGAGASGVLYATHRESSGTGVDQAHPLAEPVRLASYVFTGAELGSVLRGVGLFPALDLEAPSQLLTPLTKHFHRMSAEQLLALAGVGISLLLLCLGFLSRGGRSWVWSCWLLGHVIIVVNLVLPALGRWQLGDAQSLASRYHYATLVGLCIAALPAAAALGALHAERKWVRPALSLAAALFIAEQLAAGRAFQYFGDRHVQDREYAARLRDWNEQLLALSPDVPVAYEGTGTPLAGLYPLHLDSITPGRHPDQVYGVLHWLDPRRYPRRPL